MNVFVTGASGWIGSAVVPELLGAGHQVVGLARSDASAQRIEEMGATAWRGDVDDPDGLAKARGRCRGRRSPGLPTRGGLRRQLRRCRGGRSEGGGSHGRRPGWFRSALRACVGHARVVGREAGHRERRARPRCGGPHEPRRAPGGDRPVDPVAAGGRRSLVGTALSADRPRRRGQRLHRHLRGDRPAERRLGLCRRGHKPLAGRPPIRRRPPGPPRRRGSPGRVGPPCSGRRGCPVP